MNPLNRQFFFRGFRKQLAASMQRGKADQIWSEAGKEYARILSSDPALKAHPGATVLPAVALYRVLIFNGEDAEALLNTYSDRMGEMFGCIVHGLTSMPGVSRLLWKRIDKTMDRMSGQVWMRWLNSRTHAEITGENPFPEIASPSMNVIVKGGAVFISCISISNPENMLFQNIQPQ